MFRIRMRRNRKFKGYLDPDLILLVRIRILPSSSKKNHEHVAGAGPGILILSPLPHNVLQRSASGGTIQRGDGWPSCYGSSLGSNPDISQKYKMGDISKKVANTL
jgi:hypothetical protein